MPTPKTPAARKAALASPKPAHQSPLPAHPYDGVRELAHQAMGMVAFTVVAPLTLASALSPCPTGPASIEFAPPHAVPGNGERVPFDVKAIGEQTRQINRQADSEAAKRAQLRAMEERANQKREEMQPRREMGDFLDDTCEDIDYLVDYLP